MTGLPLQAEHFKSRAIPAEEKASQLDAEARELSAKATGVEADLSHQRDVNKHKEASIAEYQEELRNAVTRANRMGAALRTEEEKVAAAKAEAEEQRMKFEERVVAAESEAETLRKKSDEDAAHARELAERIDALRMLITTDDHSMETKNTMESEVKGAKEVQSEAEDRSVAGTEDNELKTKTGGLLSTIVDLKSKMFGAASKAEAKDAEANAKTEEAEETKETLESELDDVNDKADRGLQSSGQSLADLGEKLSTLRAERDEAVASAARVEELDARTASLESELRDKDEHIVNLEKQLQEVGVKIEKHQSAVKDREEDAVQKAKKVHRLQEEVVGMEEQNLKEGEDEFAEAPTILA